MAGLLSKGWIAELDAAARATSVPDDLRLVIQQVVTAADGTEVAYAIRLHDGRAEVRPGRAVDADVTFTQDRDTAAAIAAGEISAQAAFMAGDLRVGGDLRGVLDRARLVAGLEDLFAPVRSAAAMKERRA